MTKSLKRAFEAAARLPDQDQEELAAAILDELAAEERWAEALAGSGDTLEKLSDEALSEHAAGRTRPLDPERL